MMVRSTSLACIALCAALTGAGMAVPVAYTPPAETATLKPGPGVEVAQNYCGACHSFDYISTQPQGPGFGAPFWQAEVTKMIKVFGAPIEEPDAKAIAAYLAATYQ